MDNQETVEIQGTQDEDKQNKNTTQYVLDTNIKNVNKTLVSYKQYEANTNRTSFLCGYGFGHHKNFTLDVQTFIYTCARFHLSNLYLSNMLDLYQFGYIQPRHMFVPVTSQCLYFHWHESWSYFVFNVLSLEVIVRLVDIGGIVDDNFVSFIFIINTVKWRQVCFTDENDSLKLEN